MRAREGFHHGEGLHGFAEPHFIGEQAAGFFLRQKEKPARAFDLIGTEQVVQSARLECCDPGGAGDSSGPFGDAGFEVGALKSRNPEDPAFLPGIGVAENFFEIRRQARVRHSHASVLEPELRRTALQEPLDLLMREHRLIAGGEVDVEIQPSVLFFFEGEAGFDAHDVARDMLEPFALEDGPCFLQSRKGGGKELNDRRLALEGRFSAKVLKTAGN